MTGFAFDEKNAYLDTEIKTTQTEQEPKMTKQPYEVREGDKIEATYCGIKFTGVLEYSRWNTTDRSSTLCMIKLNSPIDVFGEQREKIFHGYGKNWTESN